MQSNPAQSVTGAEKRPPLRAYTINSFVQAFPISRTSVYEEIKAGRLKSRKIAGRTLIAVEDAETWFATHARAD